MYKINLSDGSFIVADESYELNVHNILGAKKYSVKDIITHNKKGYLVDNIMGNKTKLQFTITEDNTLDYPVGSRVKLAKDIKVGDLVMGVNNSPRIVNELHTGEDDMYEITVNGNSYVVNGGHILALVDKETGDHISVPLNIFMCMGEDYKNKFVMEIEVDDNE